MKKLNFLYTIVFAAFSANLYAQNNIQNSSANVHYPELSKPAKAMGELKVIHHNNTFKTRPHEIRKPMAHAAHQAESIVAIYDSVYYWNWDTNIAYWPNQAINKYINMIYDTHQNL